MKHVATALLLLAAACGGDPAPRPSPSAAPASVAPQVPPEAQRVRDAVENTLAACPCAVRMHLFGGSQDMELTGTYDPATKTTDLRGKDNADVLVRVVDGRTFFNPDTGDKWIELDFSGAAGPAITPFTPLTLADAGLVLAFAAQTISANVPGPGRERLETEMDAKATGAAVGGRKGEMLGRLSPTGLVTGNAFLSGDVLRALSVETILASGEPFASARLDFTRTGVAAKRVGVPANVVRTVDVTKLAS